MLASGQVFTRAEERSLTTRTVTLAVTPEQVDILVAARAKGPLSLSLRGVNDHDLVARPKPQPRPVEAPEPRWKIEEEKRQKLERELAELKAALAAAKAAPAPAPAPAPPPARPRLRYVAIYRGTAGTDRMSRWTEAPGPSRTPCRPEAAHGPRRVRSPGPTGAGPAPARRPRRRPSPARRPDRPRPIPEPSPPAGPRRIDRMRRTDRTAGLRESTPMKDLIRIVLVDPNEESRDALRRLLGTIGTFWVAEVLESYRDAAARVGEIAPDLTIVGLDHDPQQAIELIGAVTHANPQATILPASRTSDSALILRAIRAGAREFLTLPAEPAELLEIIGRLFRGREESPGAGDAQAAASSRSPGASGGVGVTSVAVNLAATLAVAKDAGDHPRSTSTWSSARSTPRSTSSPTTPSTPCSRTSSGST